MKKHTEKTLELAKKIKSQNPRESSLYYLGGSKDERKEMAQYLGMKDIMEVYSHIPPDNFFKNFSLFPSHGHEEIIEIMEKLASKNKANTLFYGDGLAQYQVPPVIDQIAGIRGLTTAYTPYQPERSQGTLISLWIYQSLMGELTGFEAINASFYDRATALYEALTCAVRITGKNKVLVSSGIYQGDIEVLQTLARHTVVDLHFLPLSEEGLTCEKLLQKELEDESYAAFAFAQVNTFGLIEDVDKLTNTTQDFKAKAIGIIDPMLIGEDGLKPPVEYGKKGADMLVGEASPLCSSPQYGGPGLGLFGIRYHKEDPRSIRQSAGRFVGKTKDIKGQDCLALVLSTREQHIRRERATSNICSNQSFMASLAGASLLARGAQGLREIALKLRKNTLALANELLQFEGVSLLYEKPFFNEFILRLPKKIHGPFLDKTKELGFPSIKITLSDTQEESDFKDLISLFEKEFSKSKKEKRTLPPIPHSSFRKNPLGFPCIPQGELFDYYLSLGQLNLSPDEAIYPLGSCTMKYNPYINDWAASLKGFTEAHPQAPEDQTQGSLEILFEIQEAFKKITGLEAVTTQPVAGAQGELVGVKMFQAYHEDKGEAQKRKYLLIPQTAHGTNPATASMAGYTEILQIPSTPDGEMDLDKISEYIKTYGEEISGIMVTNPNTAGIFEKNFSKITEMIHQVGGLVYMDGANMNAIAGHMDLKAMGVDAVHNNLHKTWSIAHGGGGPGDAIVAVGEKLKDYLPGLQVRKDERGYFETFKPLKSIGSFHRHHGNFAHKIRCYAYLLSLGTEGVKLMSAYSVLSSRYLFQKLKKQASLPLNAQGNPRMHEFILTLSGEKFQKIQEAGLKKTDIIPRIGKLFLDFGFHAPTVAFPEVFGLMIEPTESFSQKELDQFSSIVESILDFACDNPEILKKVPIFSPIARVDELRANRELNLQEKIRSLPPIPKGGLEAKTLREMKESERKKLFESW